MEFKWSPTSNISSPVQTPIEPSGRMSSLSSLSSVSSLFSKSSSV